MKMIKTQIFDKKQQKMLKKHMKALSNNSL